MKKKLTLKIFREYCIYFILIWTIGDLIILPNIIKKFDGYQLSIIIILLAITTISLVIAAIGLYFIKAWARVLFFIIGIFALTMVVVAIVLWSFSSESIGPAEVIYTLIFTSPWTSSIVYGFILLYDKNIFKDIYKDNNQN